MIISFSHFQTGNNHSFRFSVENTSQLNRKHAERCLKRKVPSHISWVAPDLTESTEAQAERGAVPISSAQRPPHSLENPEEGSECLSAKRRDSLAISSQKSFLKSQPSLGPQLPELLLPGGSTHTQEASCGLTGLAVYAVYQMVLLSPGRGRISCYEPIVIILENWVL